MQRVDPCNPLWIVTLCGCLPICGLIQSALVMGPCVAYLSTITTITNVILLPRDILYMYYYIIITPLYGPNLKFVGMILVLIPIVCFLPLTIAIYCIISIFLSLFGPTIFISDEHINYFYGGIMSVMSTTHQLVKENFKVHREFPTDLRDKLIRQCTDPFDIGLHMILIYLVLGCYSIAVMTIQSVLLGAINYIPGLIRLVCDMISIFFDICKKDQIVVFFCFIPFIIGIAISPAIAAFGYVGLIFYSIGIGCFSVKKAHEEGLINGILFPFIEFGQIEQMVNEYSYRTHQNIFCSACCQYRQVVIIDSIQAQRDDRFSEINQIQNPIIYENQISPVKVEPDNQLDISKSLNYDEELQQKSDIAKPQMAEGNQFDAKDGVKEIGVIN